MVCRTFAMVLEKDGGAGEDDGRILSGIAETTRKRGEHKRGLAPQ